MHPILGSNPTRRNGERRARIAIPLGLDVSDAAYHTAHDHPGGVPSLAQRMGTSANTLQHKVSLTNGTHHLTLREAVAMQEVTGHARGNRRCKR